MVVGFIFIPNMIALLLLSPQVVMMLKEYEVKLKRKTTKRGRLCMEETFEYILRTRGSHAPRDGTSPPSRGQKGAETFCGVPGYEFNAAAYNLMVRRGAGVGSVFVKDESFRFGLNAFKVLGGGYAIGN